MWSFASIATRDLRSMRPKFFEKKIIFFVEKKLQEEKNKITTKCRSKQLIFWFITCLEGKQDEGNGEICEEASTTKGKILSMKNFGILYLLFARAQAHTSIGDQQ